MRVMSCRTGVVLRMYLHDGTFTLMSIIRYGDILLIIIASYIHTYLATEELYVAFGEV